MCLETEVDLCGGPQCRDQKSDDPSLLLTAPLEPSPHPVGFADGFVATLFSGRLAVFLPEMFSTRARATGRGLGCTSGRFMTAA